SVLPYIRCAHQSAPLHQLSPSECPFTSGIPITLPPYIRYSHQSATLHSKYPFLSYFTIRVPFYLFYYYKYLYSAINLRSTLHIYCTFTSVPNPLRAYNLRSFYI
ncbi:unnamed protein product, partial [Staurois parvus]